MNAVSNSQCRRTYVKRAVTAVRAVVVACVLAGVPALVVGEEIERRYEGFTLWVDCEKKSAIRFYYRLGPDVGNVKREHHRCCTSDTTMPAHCRQLTTATYKPRSLGLDRGHLVPFNHMDFSREAAVESNFMVNILPQASKMNQSGGAWHKTEDITECYREHYALEIMGGPLWSSSSSPIETHGIYVPESFWKVIRRDDDSIAWIIPNVQEATEDKLGQYIVSVEVIEERTNNKVPLEIDKKHVGALDSWDVKKCKPLKKWKS